MLLKRLLFSLLFLIFLSSVSLAQDSTFHMEEVFQLPDIEREGFFIQDLLIKDLDNDGIDEIITEVKNQSGDYHILGVFHNNDWILLTEPRMGLIGQLNILDFNGDGHLDIVFAARGRNPGFFVYLGPEFDEIINDSYSYFGQGAGFGGNRILDNGESVPFIETYFIPHFIDWGRNGFHYEEYYKQSIIWQGSWLTGYPILLCPICMPISFKVKNSDNNGNEYFVAGRSDYIKKRRTRDNENIRIDEEGSFFLLFTSHNRPFDHPDSLLIAQYPSAVTFEGVFYSAGERFNFCRYSAVDDFNNDGRLEWAQPHWERINFERNFTIHLPVYFPDSLVFNREYTEILRDPCFLDNSPPILTKGIAAVDVNADGVMELLFAIQGRPILIINSQTMEVIMESDIETWDDYFWVFEVGHFDDSGRLQVIMQNARRMIVYNLPEGWDNR